MHLLVTSIVLSLGQSPHALQRTSDFAETFQCQEESLPLTGTLRQPSRIDEVGASISFMGAEADSFTAYCRNCIIV